jgi:uncharacterized protein (DUF433 family)
MATRSRSFRVDETTLKTLDRLASKDGLSANQLAATLLEEGLRMKAFPGIGFTTSKMGYRPVLAGTRLAVWEVAATLLSNAGDVALTARDLGIAPDQVDVCARYYTAFQSEVDALTAELERAEAAERELRERQHAIFS